MTGPPGTGLETFVLMHFMLYPSKFVGMESLIISMMDMFPMVLRRAGRREMFLLLFCLTCFFGQLVMVTEVRGVCRCVCVCVRERERETERERHEF